MATFDQSSTPAVSVILPTYQERDNIVPLVEELRGAFAQAGVAYQIIVIDDRSPDGTAEVARTAFAGDAGVVVHVRSEKPGLAVSIRDGIERSSGSVVLVMDTDFNHKPSDALLLFQVTQFVDLTIGSRFVFGGGMSSKSRYFLSYIYNIFMRILLGTRMDDNLSGMFAIRRAALSKLEFDKIFWGYGDYFFRLLLLSQRNQLTHVQIPIFYGERVAGESKTRFLNVFGKYTKEVLRLFFLKAMNRW